MCFERQSDVCNRIGKYRAFLLVPVGCSCPFKTVAVCNGIHEYRAFLSVPVGCTCSLKGSLLFVMLYASKRPLSYLTGSEYRMHNAHKRLTQPLKCSHSESLAVEDIAKQLKVNSADVRNRISYWVAQGMGTS